MWHHSSLNGCQTFEMKAEKRKKRPGVASFSRGRGNFSALIHHHPITHNCFFFLLSSFEFPQPSLPGLFAVVPKSNVAVTSFDIKIFFTGRDFVGRRL
jgi:hypothetical protein